MQITDITKLTNVSSEYIKEAEQRFRLEDGIVDKDFESVFQTALNMVDETNALSNKAESEEIRFILGEAENTHDLLIAQEKANVALQYTVAVRDKVHEAYREIMQMQM